MVTGGTLAPPQWAKPEVGSTINVAGQSWVVAFSGAAQLIAAEGELKKVNWSSRQEVVVSTIVVIVVVVAMAVLLGTTDFVFKFVFDALLGAKPGPGGVV